MLLFIGINDGTVLMFIRRTSVFSRRPPNWRGRGRDLGK